ncbi:hypothetical protein BDZ97DRAFT_1388597 [Flammula alnicola]|nr:hypothetical protein BDZ97DRAFT_1388597 [Flammula alnicola]
MTAQGPRRCYASARVCLDPSSLRLRAYTHLDPPLLLPAEIGGGASFFALAPHSINIPRPEPRNVCISGLFHNTQTHHLIGIGSGVGAKVSSEVALASPQAYVYRRRVSYHLVLTTGPSFQILSAVHSELFSFRFPFPESPSLAAYLWTYDCLMDASQLLNAIYYRLYTYLTHGPHLSHRAHAPCDIDFGTRVSSSGRSYPRMEGRKERAVAGRFWLMRYALHGTNKGRMT